MIGIDSNVDETMQAKKVFQHLDNVKFINGDIRSVSANLGKFDIIVFAASLQYFQSLASIIPFALSILHPGGEIHIVDSPIYNKMDLPLAIERSKRYYDQVGFPEMTKQYFHHSYEELRRYNHTLLFDPVSWKNRLLGKHGFPWVCIKNQK